MSADSAPGPASSAFDWDSWLSVTVPTHVGRGPLIDRVEFLREELMPKFDALAKRNLTAGSAGTDQPSMAAVSRAARYLVTQYLQQAALDRDLNRTVLAAGRTLLGAGRSLAVLAATLTHLLGQLAEAQPADLGLASLAFLPAALACAGEPEPPRTVVVPAWLGQLRATPADVAAGVCIPRVPAARRLGLLHWFLVILEVLYTERLATDDAAVEATRRDLSRVALRAVASLLYGLVAGTPTPAYLALERHSSAAEFSLDGSPFDPAAHGSTARQLLRTYQQAGADSADGEAVLATKPGIAQSALTAVRRFLRAHRTQWDPLLALLLDAPAETAPTSPDSLERGLYPVDLVLLGCVWGAAARHRRLADFPAIEALRTRYSDASTRYLVHVTAATARGRPHPNVLALTGDTWALVGPASLTRAVFPAWEKAVLRHPEVAIPTLAAVVPFLRAGPASVWTGVVDDSGAATASPAAGSDGLGTALFNQLRVTRPAVRAAWLRLATLTAELAVGVDADQFAERLLEFVLADKPAPGPEAKQHVWAALELLARDSRRATAAPVAETLGRHAPARPAAECKAVESSPEDQATSAIHRSFALVRRIESHLTRETHEAAAVAALRCYTAHTLTVLADPTALGTAKGLDADFAAWWNAAVPVWTTAVAKADKPELRRQWANAVGDLAWYAHKWLDEASPDGPQGRASAFRADIWQTQCAPRLAEPLAKGLQAAAKKLLDAPLTYLPGPTEGYVAVTVTQAALAVGTKALWPTKIDAWVRAAVRPAATGKTTGLFVERIYAKLTLASEVRWLLRAVTSCWPAAVQGVRVRETALATANQIDDENGPAAASGDPALLALEGSTDEALALARVLVHFALHPTQRSFRSLARTTLAELGTTSDSAVLAKCLQPALDAWLSDREAEVAADLTTPQTATAEDSDAESKQQRERDAWPGRVYDLLTALFASHRNPSHVTHPGAGVPSSDADHRLLCLVLGDYTSVAHHPLLATPAHVGPLGRQLAHLHHRQVTDKTDQSADKPDAEPYHGPTDSAFWAAGLPANRVPWWANPAGRSNDRYATLWVTLVQGCGVDPAGFAADLRLPLAAVLLRLARNLTPPPAHEQIHAAGANTTSKAKASTVATKPSVPATTAKSTGATAKKPAKKGATNMDDLSLMFSAMNKKGSGAAKKPVAAKLATPAASAGPGAKPATPVAPAPRQSRPGFYRAALGALSTLGFVDADAFVPLVWHYVARQLDRVDQADVTGDAQTPYPLSHLTSIEVDIWRYQGDPAEPVVDVLGRRGRGKTGSTAALSKEESALVADQLAKETLTRTRVQLTYRLLREALDLLTALTHAARWQSQALFENQEAETLPLHLLFTPILRRLLLGDSKRQALLPLAGPLIGSLGARVLEDLALVTSPRLRPLCAGLVAAVLRLNRVTGVPHAWTVEPVGDLALRILYRLHFQAQTVPYGAATFTLVYTLLQPIIRAPACGAKDLKPSRVATSNEDAEYAEADPVAERLLLCNQLLGRHGPILAATPTAPRREAITALLGVMAQSPAQVKPACDHLLSLAEAMDLADNATQEEKRAVLDGWAAPDTMIRAGVLHAADALDLTDLDFDSAVWAARYDPDGDNAELASRIWVESVMEVPAATYFDDLRPFLTHAAAPVRSAGAAALAAAITVIAQEATPAAFRPALVRLTDWYVQLAAPVGPEYDRFGMVIPSTLNRIDPFPARVALGECLAALAEPVTTADDVRYLVHFLIAEGPLGDRSGAVRAQMLTAGLRLVEHHGAACADHLVAEFDAVLQGDRVSDADTETADAIRESVVVLYGALARFLSPKDPRVGRAVSQLLSALATPSESVQRSVAECLAPLTKGQMAIVPDWTARLTKTLFGRGGTYAARRGAAYGLAGIVRGVGIRALWMYELMPAVQTHLSDASTDAREGALLAVETLADTLGSLFEPYAVQLVPALLTSFADSDTRVRQATGDACQAIMAHLSPYGVRRLLPSLLRGLHDSLWRTKAGSADILNRMAYCAPEQLSICLPRAVPELVEALTDSHVKVREACERALRSFGGVITNPEVEALVPLLLRGLFDPAHSTSRALDGLLRTAFVHYVDPPSLALIVPILRRGLITRGTLTKRQAAQVVGSMVVLTAGRDLVSYLPALVPHLRQVLGDPVPDTRATAAKALGLLVRTLGEVYFTALVDDLLASLRTRTTTTERSGAAQGLSEILAGLGVERMESLLPEVVKLTASPEPHVREGYMALLIYLPLTFGTRFQPYITQVVAPVVTGLADESEYARDAALRAGQILIRHFLPQSIELLLPQLEGGVFDTRWRIRNSSVELIGDLLFQITGLDGTRTDKALGNAPDVDASDDEDGDGVAANTNAGSNDAQNARGRKAKEAKAAARHRGKVTPEAQDDDDDDEEAAVVAVSADECRRRMLAALGRDRRDAVLAALYVVRSDTVAVVRQTTTAIWKSLVSNTPRTVKEVLAPIMDLILTQLASGDDDGRRTATRALGDLTRKLGESVLGRVLPILQAGLAPDRPLAQRRGACLGLGEVIQTVTRNHLEDHAELVVSSVRAALCDEATEVREAAAGTFDALQSTWGARATDDIVPHLLLELRNPATSDRALAALRNITGVRASAVFPTLIPKLTEPPITAFNARALAALVQVAGSALARRLGAILTALLSALVKERDPETLEALRDAITNLVGAIDGTDGLHHLMLLLFEYVRPDQPAAARIAGCGVLATLCRAHPNLDYSEYGPAWVGTLVELFGVRDDPELVATAWDALDALVKAYPKESLDDLVSPAASALTAATDSARSAGVTILPGFALPKGPAPVLPIGTQGLLVGAPDSREAAADLLGLVVEFTPGETLRPYVTQVTGPLIRIVGDRHPPAVKATILATLVRLLAKVPTFLRAFVPQLQRTFVKCLADPALSVRRQAVAALAALVGLQPRLDALVSELCAGSRGDGDVRAASLLALAAVLAKGTVSDAAREQARTALLACLADPTPAVRLAAAEGFGRWLTGAQPSSASEHLNEALAAAPGPHRLPLYRAVLEFAPAVATASVADIVTEVQAGIRDAQLVIPAVGTAYFTLRHADQLNSPASATTDLAGALTDALREAHSDGQLAALVAVGSLSRRAPGVLAPRLTELVPLVLSLTNSRVTPVKHAAEHALLYLLDLGRGNPESIADVTSDTYRQVSKAVDGETARALAECLRRTLAPLALKEPTAGEGVTGDDREDLAVLRK
ncbi:translational activator of GCN4 [Tieghemiomyces parasiticus]|uniref:Translational activator of GCN4 n=1 Tax=Tieghemiomyces parasiticus TaxID=78921 RepID=A0A9W7ZQS4_9FUNG|nr:translational activator of GCN4 [Tieghemiomyces parasiticus]